MHNISEKVKNNYMLSSYSSDNTFKMHQPFFKDGVFDYKEIYIEKPYYALFYEFTTSYSSTSGLACVPNGCVDIMFVTGSDEPFMEFIGSPTELKTVRCYPHSRYFGVRLKPGMYLSYQNVPLKDITNSEHFFSANSGILKNFFVKLKKCISFEQRISLFNQFFEPFAETGSAGEITQRMLCEINASKGSIHIIRLAENMNYSERHISRIFQETMGISPKNFARIVRFQNVIETILCSSPHQMSDYFIDLGYSDQAHFQREFKQYSGMTPKNFMKYVFHV